uniref:Uncharacterized protein n=1 Tax=Anguilla anguilla TaxID=7936 RepID=A0A0E9WQ85_ANGAN
MQPHVSLVCSPPGMQVLSCQKYVKGSASVQLKKRTLICSGNLALSMSHFWRQEKVLGR